MTIENPSFGHEYTGNGATTRFPFTNKITDKAVDLGVYLLAQTTAGVAIRLEYNVDYTVENVSSVNGGNVVYPKVSSGRPVLETGHKIFIEYDYPVEQPLTVVNYERIFTGSLTDSLDTIVRAIIAIKSQNKRALVSHVGGNTTDVTALIRQIEAAVKNSQASATQAAESAANALLYANQSSSSYGQAFAQATKASTSATGAASSATAAASSAARAAASAMVTAQIADNFDDTYLGTKTSAPTVDNDGNTLRIGALYFNSTLGHVYVWNGAEWVRLVGGADALSPEELRLKLAESLPAGVLYDDLGLNAAGAVVKGRAGILRGYGASFPSTDAYYPGDAFLLAEDTAYDTAGIYTRPEVGSPPNIINGIIYRPSRYGGGIHITLPNGTVYILHGINADDRTIGHSNSVKIYGEDVFGASAVIEVVLVNSISLVSGSPVDYINDEYVYCTFNQPSVGSAYNRYTVRPKFTQVQGALSIRINSNGAQTDTVWEPIQIASSDYHVLMRSRIGGAGVPSRAAWDSIFPPPNDGDNNPSSYTHTGGVILSSSWSLVNIGTSAAKIKTELESVIKDGTLAKNVGLDADGSLASTDKLSNVVVVDSLTSTSKENALSADRGRILKDLIDSAASIADGGRVLPENATDYVDGRVFLLTADDGDNTPGVYSFSQEDKVDITQLTGYVPGSGYAWYISPAGRKAFNFGGGIGTKNIGQISIAVANTYTEIVIGYSGAIAGTLRIGDVRVVANLPSGDKYSLHINGVANSFNGLPITSSTALFRFRSPAVATFYNSFKANRADVTFTFILGSLKEEVAFDRPSGGSVLPENATDYVDGRVFLLTANDGDNTPGVYTFSPESKAESGQTTNIKSGTNYLWNIPAANRPSFNFGGGIGTKTIYGITIIQTSSYTEIEFGLLSTISGDIRTGDVRVVANLPSGEKYYLHINNVANSFNGSPYTAATVVLRIRSTDVATFFNSFKTTWDDATFTFILGSLKEAVAFDRTPAELRTALIDGVDRGGSVVSIGIDTDNNVVASPYPAVPEGPGRLKGAFPHLPAAGSYAGADIVLLTQTDGGNTRGLYELREDIPYNFAANYPDRDTRNENSSNGRRLRLKPLIIDNAIPYTGTSTYVYKDEITSPEVGGYGILIRYDGSISGVFPQELSFQIKRGNAKYTGILKENRMYQSSIYTSYAYYYISSQITQAQIDALFLNPNVIATDGYIAFAPIDNKWNKLADLPDTLTPDGARSLVVNNLPAGKNIKYIGIDSAGDMASDSGPSVKQHGIRYIGTDIPQDYHSYKADDYVVQTEDDENAYNTGFGRRAQGIGRYVDSSTRATVTLTRNSYDVISVRHNYTSVPLYIAGLGYVALTHIKEVSPTFTEVRFTSLPAGRIFKTVGTINFDLIINGTAYNITRTPSVSGTSDSVYVQFGVHYSVIRNYLASVQLRYTPLEFDTLAKFNDTEEWKSGSYGFLTFTRRNFSVIGNIYTALVTLANDKRLLERGRTLPLSDMQFNINFNPTASSPSAQFLEIPITPFELSEARVYDNQALTIYTAFFQHNNKFMSLGYNYNTYTQFKYISATGATLPTFTSNQRGVSVVYGYRNTGSNQGLNQIMFMTRRNPGTNAIWFNQIRGRPLA